MEWFFGGKRREAARLEMTPQLRLRRGEDRRYRLRTFVGLLLYKEVTCARNSSRAGRDSTILSVGESVLEIFRVHLGTLAEDEMGREARAELGVEGSCENVDVGFVRPDFLGSRARGDELAGFGIGGEAIFKVGVLDTFVPRSPWNACTDSSFRFGASGEGESAKFGAFDVPCAFSDAVIFWEDGLGDVNGFEEDKRFDGYGRYSDLEDSQCPSCRTS